MSSDLVSEARSLLIGKRIVGLLIEDESPDLVEGFLAWARDSSWASWATPDIVIPSWADLEVDLDRFVLEADFVLLDNRFRKVTLRGHSRGLDLVPTIRSLRPQIPIFLHTAFLRDLREDEETAARVDRLVAEDPNFHFFEKHSLAVTAEQSDILGKMIVAGLQGAGERTGAAEFTPTVVRSKVTSVTDRCYSLTTFSPDLPEQRLWSLDAPAGGEQMVPTRLLTNAGIDSARPLVVIRITEFEHGEVLTSISEGRAREVVDVEAIRELIESEP